jgi:FKBP-type peptidyl-prolyl cis-trans isomerase FkpA
MNKTIGVVAFAILLFAVGCKDQSFKKTALGKVEYRTSGGSGEPVKYGNAIRFQVAQYYSDSLMATPFDTVAQIIEIDSTKLPKEYIEVFTSAKKGDSVFTRTLITDSMVKAGQLPPFAKPGNYFGFHFKILDIVTDLSKVPGIRAESMESMRKIDSVTAEKQKVIDDSTLSAYLSKNNIKATKTAKGTYVEITDPGTGDAVDSGKAITVDYRGMTLDGKEFDSSYDSTGKSVKPYSFMVGQQRGAIGGWSDGLVLFKKGGKGKLFIPSYLAYGQRGAGADIKPNTPIMFDVSVTDVLTQDQYRAKMEERQKEMQEEMKKMQDIGKQKRDSSK